VVNLRIPFAATLAVLPLAFAWSPAHADDEQQVAIVDAFKASEEVNREVRNAIERSVNLLSAELIPHSLLSGQLQACTEIQCRVEVARLAGADYVFVLSGQHDTQSFDLRTEVWSGTTGRKLGDASKSCALCTLKELFAAAEDHAATLLSRARTAVDVAPVEKPAEVKRPQWIGWTAAVAGTALATAAGILWARDGDCVTSGTARRCIAARESPGGAALPWLTIGGALGAGAGILMLSGAF
jgi:hypothetical protein